MATILNECAKEQLINFDFLTQQATQFRLCAQVNIKKNVSFNILVN